MEAYFVVLIVPFSCMFTNFYYFLVWGGPKRAWEVFKRLPGGRGFVLTKYGPVGSHGDPIQRHLY